MAGFPTRGEAQRRSGFRFLLNYATKYAKALNSKGSEIIPGPFLHWRGSTAAQRFGGDAMRRVRFGQDWHGAG